MDVFERFNAKFGKWYEGLFGGEAGELRPKDVLRKIITAMEDNRKEGFDSKVYVPNKYVLKLAVDDPEERDYLLSFLDEEELVSVLKRFMAQNHYHARGPLDFTIAEVPAAERDAHREKLRVKVRFEKGAMEPPAVQAAPPAPGNVGAGIVARSSLAPPLSGAEGAIPGIRTFPDDDLPTVPGVGLDEEPGTVPAVAWASLAVTAPDGRKSLFSLTKPSVTVGRSRNMGNDLVLDSDGMASKVHARLERERDGRWTVYDLGSTNGTQVNGQRVEGNRVLADGDRLLIGATTLVFQESGREERPAAPAPPLSGAGGAAGAAGALPRRARLVTDDGEEHVLASETLIGRAVTSDVVLDDPGVSTRHARIVAPDPATYYIEDLDSAGGTWLNGQRLEPRRRVLLSDGDTLRLGGRILRFSGGGAGQ